MKRIDKLPEPQLFSDWKASDKMKHRPNWNRVSGKIKKVIHNALLAEQGYICCYCERRVSKDDSHTEHFRPKSFKQLQLDYSNLHCSCQKNRKPDDPLQCGALKGDCFDEHLLISPLACDCEDRFSFTAYGNIFPRQKNDRAAKATIKKLGLDLDRLNAMRAKAVDALYDLPADQIKRLLADDTDGRFLEFHTTIKQVLT